MRATLAILKNCLPKGIPTIVRQRKQPSKKLTIASSIPENRNQKMFRTKEKQSPLVSISLPKGLSEIEASLKH